MSSHIIQREYYRASSGVEAHRVIDAWQLTFNLGCVLKYFCRAGSKVGATVESDLNKALTYIDFEIDFYDRLLKGDQQVLKFEDRSPPIDVRYMPDEVSDAWGLSSEKASALRLIFKASCAYRAHKLEAAITALEDLIPLVLEARNG